MTVDDFSGTGPPTALVRLIDDVTRAVTSSEPGQPTLDAVAAVLATRLADPELLADQPSPVGPGPGGDVPAGAAATDDYREEVVHVAVDGSFSIVVLRWQPGQATPVHDHVAWAVVGVHAGAEYETRYEVVDEQLIAVARSRVDAGHVSALLPPGDIHRVSNDGDDLAVSIHVYGADVRRGGSSVRRIYPLPAS